jgi:hypothetical protein
MSLASAPITAGSLNQAQTSRSTLAATPKSMDPPTLQLQQSSFSQQQYLLQPFQPLSTANTDPRFTTVLPANFQTLVDSALDPYDPIFIAGSQYTQISFFYDFEPTLFLTYSVSKSAMSAITSRQMYPSFIA